MEVWEGPLMWRPWWGAHNAYPMIPKDASLSDGCTPKWCMGNAAVLNCLVSKEMFQPSGINRKCLGIRKAYTIGISFCREAQDCDLRKKITAIRHIAERLESLRIMGGGRQFRTILNALEYYNTMVSNGLRRPYFSPIMSRGVEFLYQPSLVFPTGWHNTFRQQHTEKYFPNLVKSTRNQIVFTMQCLIWIQTDVRLDPNQSENGKYNLISGWFNKIWKIFLCVRNHFETRL